MNIKTINDAIKDLESANTTVNNVQELALLYIVREHLIKDRVEQELNDILPAYKKYVDIKRKYQMKEVSKECVVESLRNVCNELNEFITTLYSCTDMQDERNLLDDFKRAL